MSQTFVVVSDLFFYQVYKTEVVEQMLQPGGFISSWGQRHLASNIIIAETNEPLSNQYTLLQGRNSRILVFGFIYHLQNPSPKVVVLDPNDAMAQPWFETALQENEYDAILVMAHMGIDDEAVSAIRNGIRGIIGDGMPIQFVAGHTHQRRYTQVDDWSMAVESGRYLDTIGFMSFPTQTTIETLASNVSTIDLFQHVFLDANVNMLKYALDTDETFATNDGTELKDFIMQTQNELGLDKILGCSPMDYFINRSLQEPDSLWAVYRDFVVPTQLEQDSDTNRAILISQGSWRYDLFMGENTLDDIVAVSPFNEPIYLVGKMPCQIILSLQDNFNANTTQNFYDVLPAYILSGAVNAGEECELYTHRFDLQSILDSLVLLQPGVVYNAETTNLTSTTIWTGFIQTEWRCQDAKGVHIPWLDSHKIVNESGETNGKNLAIVVSASLVSILFLCGLCFACFRISRGRQPVGDTEMNAFKEDAPIEAEFT